MSINTYTWKNILYQAENWSIRFWRNTEKDTTNLDSAILLNAKEF